MIRNWWKVAAALFVMAVLAAGCSSGDADDEPQEGSRAAVPSSIPPECEGYNLGQELADGEAPPDPDTTTTIPQSCLDAVYKTLIQESGSDELKSIDPDLQISLAYGACSYAQSGRESNAPSRGIPAFIDLNLAAWKSNVKSFQSDLSDEEVDEVMNETVINEIIATAAALCPEDMQYLQEVSAAAGATQIKIVVISSGDSEITYTIADGSEVTETVSKTWEFMVSLDPVTNYSFRARSTDAEVTCQIWVGNTVIAEEEAAAGDFAACAVTESDIRTA